MGQNREQSLEQDRRKKNLDTLTMFANKKSLKGNS